MKQTLRLLAYGLAASLCSPLLAAPTPHKPAPASEQKASPKSAQKLAAAEREESASAQLDAELFYELLLGEMYAYRGEAAPSVELLLDAARRSGDAKVYQRAAQVALLSRSAEQATMVARAWKEAHPQSSQANRFLLQVLLATNQGEATRALLKQEIANAPAAEKREFIQALPRIYSRLGNRALAASIVRDALAPELENPATGGDAWVAIGRVELAAGEKLPALESTRRAMAIDANNEGAARLAADLVNEGVSEAEPLVKAYLDKSSSADAHLAYARSLMGAQRFDEALQQTRRATELDADSPDAWMLKAIIEAQTRQYAEADVSLLKLDTLTPKLPSSVLQREVRIQSLMLREQMAEAQQKWAEAEQWARQIGEAGNQPLSTLRLASIRMQQGRFDDAEALLDKLPQDTQADQRTKLAAQVQLQKTAKNYTKALALQAKLVQLSPNDNDALYEQAMLAERLNDIDQMELLLRRIIARKNDYYHAYNALGYSLADRGLKLDEAKTLIETALKMSPGDPMITDSLGWVEYKLGNHERAAQLLEEAYTKMNDPEIGAHLAQVWWTQGKKQAAESLLRTVLKDAPDNEALLKTFQQLGLKP
ncbi:tetratricopeptide repeat protein [Comamonas humi]